MTNGEKLISDFPYIKIKGQDKVFTTIQIDTTGTGTPIIVYTEWWNAEYKEPTTKNNLGVDCISRIETIDYLCKHCPDDGECFKDCDEIKHLRQMPSVTPIRPKGHWIGHGEHCRNLGVIPSGLGAYEWCSNCDCGIDVREWHRNNYNFCPNCGAEMRASEV
jgi:hypothetical protein